MNHVPKMNETEFVDLTFFYNFYSLHIPVERVSIIASLSEKKRSKVRGFDSTCEEINDERILDVDEA
jgi:hypothetical protein